MSYPGFTLADLQSCSGALTIELDLNGVVAEQRPPAPLARALAAEVGGCLAADLERILSGIAQVGLVVPGAVYDQTDVLRPGFPLARALEQIYRGALRHDDFTPQLIALGTDSGRFPVDALNPPRLPGSGPLLLLPFTLIGRQGDILPLSSQMENVLLQTGAVSIATRDAVLGAFGLQAVSMSYATIADLCALLQVQLENHGFDGLWRLLEHALFQRRGVQQIRLENGAHFVLLDTQVYAPFYTFDDWAQSGPGRTLAVDRLPAAYGDWLRSHRQYTLTLEAHGLEVRRVLANAALEQENPEAVLAAAQQAQPLAGSYLIETVITNDSGASESRRVITHQFDQDSGTLAYTVLALDSDGGILSLENYYPLRPEGLSAVIDQLRQRSVTIDQQVLHPRTLVYSSERRCLQSAA